MAIPLEAFALDPGDKGALQRRIRRLIAEAILSGRFRPLDRLPSSRALAEHLGVSRITVTLVYAELQADGYLESRLRSGFFVAEQAPRRESFAPPAFEGRAPVDWGKALLRAAPDADFPDKPAEWRSYPYRFIYGQMDEGLFDHHHWRLCAAQALGRRELPGVAADAFERDDPELIRHIAAHTLPRRGVYAAPSEILITMGAQNALWLCAQVLLEPGRTAAMESPGYMGLRAILRRARCGLAFAPVDKHGLRFEDLPPGVNVAFITPSHQCPTNATMPLERRRALLEHAAAHDYLIVEDDYEFEMPFARASAPAVKSLDRDGRVIYIGSFSKSMFPGLRLGYLAAPEPFIREARALRAAALRHPPGLIQRAVANFLSLGHHDALISRMSAAYRERRAAMAEAIGRYGLTPDRPQASGGSSFWMRLAPGADAGELAARLRGRGVLIEPGHWFFDPAQAPRHYYRLAYSSIDAAKIPEGIRIIADEARRAGYM